jgi:predicted glutamine amidotransferase
MFAYVGRSRADLNALHSALKDSCTQDECLSPLKLPAGNSHKDGWGYVIRVQGSIYHYRSSDAIFRDSHKLPVFADDQEIQAIFHGRLTTGGVTGNPIFSHPFVGYTDREILFFAHSRRRCRRGTTPASRPIGR